MVIAATERIRRERVDRLASMRVFVKVVESSGFAGAAAKLGATPSMVTKHVNRLEAHLGVRLLNRTTRRVSLTEAGSAYYERCVALLGELDETEALVGRHGAEPHGTLRLTAPSDFAGLHLGKPVAAFMERYPEVAVDLACSNRVVDLVEEGFDAGIRVAPRLEGNFVARRVAASRLVVCASPGYLRAHGTPRTPGDLAQHACVCFSEPAPMVELRYTLRGKTGTVRLRERLRTNQSMVLLQATLDGRGVCLMPTFLAGAALKGRRLRRVLPDADFGTAGVHVVYPHRKFLLAKVRAFTEFLVDWFGGEPHADPFVR
jgi:DNA-binding transcriptional LysR family regulator